MLQWDKYGFDKKLVGTCYDKLVFLHSLGSTAHVVHSVASGPSGVDALFFMLGSDWYGFYKKRNGTHYAKRVFHIRWDLRVT
jgi:hypothetical protein